MKKKASDMSVFEMVKAGLEDSIAFSKNEKMSLVTTYMPAPPPQMAAEDVAEVREQLNMSQSLFAAALNVSTKTVQAWEQGERSPNNASLRLLQIAKEEPQVVLKAVRPKAGATGAARRTSFSRRGRPAAASVRKAAKRMSSKADR